MGRIVEGLWDCPYCGTKGIGGSKRTCTNCGRARDGDTRFYMSGQKRYLSSSEARKINKNPDWVCDYCGNLNSDDDTECHSCGAKRTSENLDYFQNMAKKENSTRQENQLEVEQRTYERESPSDEKSCVDYSCSRMYEESDFNYSCSQLNEESEKSESGQKSFDFENLKGVIIFLSAFALITGLIIGLVFLLSPKEKELTITNLSWERNIEIEEYKTVNENDWYLPTGGRLHYTNREIHHYEDVFDHYETRTRQVPRERYVRTETIVTGYRDLGNGYFEEITSTRDVYETYYETETYQEAVYRSEPVYRTKYYYEIDKWLYGRTATSKANDKTPQWPELNLSDKERESSRNETYSAIGKDGKEEEYTFTLSYSDWQMIHLGQSVKVKLSFGKGEIVSVDEKFVVYEQE